MVPHHTVMQALHNEHFHGADAWCTCATKCSTLHRLSDSGVPYDHKAVARFLLVQLSDGSSTPVVCRK